MPRYPSPTPEQKRNAATAAARLNAPVNLGGAQALDIFAQPSTYPAPGGLNVDSLLRGADTKGFKPLVEVQKLGGIMAKDLQDGSAVHLPQQTQLILGIKLGNTTLCQAARHPEEFFSLLLDLRDMANGAVVVPRPTLDLLCGNTVETRTEGFHGLESLLAVKEFFIEGISGQMTFSLGDLVCHGTCPIENISDFAVFRTVDRSNPNAAEYSIVEQHHAQQLIHDGMLVIADGIAHGGIRGFNDYTPDDQDLSASKNHRTAEKAFDACSDRCQLVRINQGDRVKLRYLQANGVNYYRNLTTNEDFAHRPGSSGL